MTLSRSLEWQYQPVSEDRVSQADAIVVLGGVARAQSFPRPTHELNEAADRLVYAARLFKNNAAPYIVLSGGQVIQSGAGQLSEAEIMASLLTDMGVPNHALILETDSWNTYENATESLKILDERGAASILLVTSALHMPRAIQLFEQSELDVIPAPTDFLVTHGDWQYYTQPNVDIQLMNLLPGADDLALTSRVIKEYIGLIIYKLRGWI